MSAGPVEGGTGTVNNTDRGAGGRIALRFTSNRYTGPLSAAGGDGCGIGGAGTIYAKPHGLAGERRAGQELRGEWTLNSPPVDRGDYVEVTVRSSEPVTTATRGFLRLEVRRR